MAPDQQMRVPAAPERLETERMVLRRPVRDDMVAIFDRYASDPEVTHYLSWKRHTTLEDTLAFLEFSDSEWVRWACGPYLALSKANGLLLGSTGLALEEPSVASTGYVFARDAWGRGYATEALRAMVKLSDQLGVQRLYAVCHMEHRASARVMEKCGLQFEGVRPSEFVFPNIGPEKQDVLSYVHVL